MHHRAKKVFLLCQKSSNSTLDSIKLPNEWKELLGDFLQSPSFASIKAEYLCAYRAGKILYPPAKLLFKAFYLTLPQNVRVVILGQDPYHGALRVRDSNGVETLIPQAMGLSFSVPATFTQKYLQRACAHDFFYPAKSRRFECVG